MARHGRPLRTRPSRPTTPAEGAVVRGWLAGLAAPLLVIFPLYGWAASGFAAPAEFVGTYASALPYIGGLFALGSVPLMFLAMALARRFEGPLMRAPVLWAHVSAGLLLVGMLGLWVALLGPIDTGDAGQRGIILVGTLGLIVATEAFLWSLPRR